MEKLNQRKYYMKSECSCGDKMHKLAKHCKKCAGKKYNKIGITGMLGKKQSEHQKRIISKLRKGATNTVPRTAFKKESIPWNKGKKLMGWKPWNYIDGRSKLLSPGRYGDDWEAIRLLIYKRDNYQCQDCGMTMNELGKPLDVHHKIPFLISFDNSLSNLIALCKSCHRKVEAIIMRELKNQKTEVPSFGNRYIPNL